MTLTAPPPARAETGPQGPNSGAGAPVPAAPPQEPPRVAAPVAAQIGSLLLALVSGTLLLLVANLVVVSQIEHFDHQKALYGQLRLSLAEGSTPVGPTTHTGQLVKPGTPVAVMRAPDIGLAQEVIVEGTAPEQTMLGIGHERDTVLPCQVGASALMARRGAYGGTGSKWSELQLGARFTITMGQGSCAYQVIDIRHAGDKSPAAPTGREGLLTLTTASGSPYMPTGVEHIDAKLTGDGFSRSADQFPSFALSPAEQPMGADTTGAGWSVFLLAEVLIAIAVGGILLWRKWGRWQAWIVMAPIGFAFALLAATDLNRLLPNLL